MNFFNIIFFNLPPPLPPKSNCPSPKKQASTNLIIFDAMGYHFQANMETLEAKNEMLQSKLENQELEAKMQKDSLEKVGILMIFPKIYK
jgi:hypothetical protein